jgi:hypothetical protein
MLDLLIKGRSQFGRGHGQRDDFGRLGQATTGDKLPIVFFALGVNLQAVRDDARAMRVPAGFDRALQIGSHRRRAQMISALVDVDFKAGVFQIDKRINGLAQG